MKIHVGDIVYPYGRALAVGKVIEEVGYNFPAHVTEQQRAHPDQRNFWKTVRVRWLKKGNPETVEWARNLYRLHDLIHDHNTKLAGHMDRLRKAEAL